MGRFASPQNLFLHLGQPLVAAFHRQVAARNHDPCRLARHRRVQHFRKVLETAAGFDLQDQPELRGAQLEQGALQGPDIGCALRERQADKVGMACRHREVLQVLGGQGRQFEAGVRQIDSLVAAQMLATIAGLRDLDFESVSHPAPHAAADAAVIEPDLCTRAHLLQSLGQSARDRRRARPGTPGAGSRGVPRAGSKQMQHLAALKFEAPGHRRQLAQAGLVHA